MKKRRFYNWLDRKLPKTFLQFTLLRIRNNVSGGTIGFRVIQTKNIKEYHSRRYFSRSYDIAGRYNREEALQKALEEIFIHYGLARKMSNSQHLPSIENIGSYGRYKLFDLEIYLDIALWDLAVFAEVKNMRS